MKGKDRPVEVYELLGMGGEPLKSEDREWLHSYEEGLSHYQHREWDTAIVCFRQALRLKPHDGPSRIYLLRCQEFRNNPPDDDWDGVFRLRSK